ncbi:hypothetical protein AVEN_144452-1 [Araneus ventricosus]|uniref:Uncharacterized protein n=1 Tax=Araneus ventricosus TaxID=182803 RepID=A0A4Y2E141_ARAVE|nr:hypothetical protein AVEN_144452-1 [Araneus ventricosus]
MKSFCLTGSIVLDRESALEKEGGVETPQRYRPPFLGNSTHRFSRETSVHCTTNFHLSTLFAEFRLQPARHLCIDSGRNMYLTFGATIAWWHDIGFGAGGLQTRNPILLKIRRVWTPLHIKSYLVVQHSPAGVVWEFGAQVSSSSSDRSSELQSPSQTMSYRFH